MSLTERSRSALYLGLRSIVDETAIEEMLSYFPARDVEEPVTKEFLRAEVADLRTEMAVFKTELRGEMADLRTELRGEMADLRTEMGALKADLRGEMAELRTEFRTEMAAMEARLQLELHAAIRSQTQWLVGVLLTLSAVIVAAVAIVS